jgi:hypothetical protein
MHQRTNLILTLSAILLIHLLFFAIRLIRSPEPLPDSSEYLHAAANFYSQGTLYCGDLSDPIREELFTRRPPLYPFILGVTLAAGSKLPVFLLQALFSLLSVYLVTVIFGPGQRSPGNRFFLFLLIFMIATPAQFIYANRIMAEIPLQLILVLMAFCVYRYFAPPEKGDPSRNEAFPEKGTPPAKRASANSGGRCIWVFYLLLTLGMALKPVLFPFFIPAFLISVYMFARTKKVVWIGALIIPILWITSYCLYNLNRTGSAQYSSIQTANMVNYNFRYFIMAKEGSESASQAVDLLYDHCGVLQDYAEKNRCLSRGVRETILKDPFRYGIFHLKGSIRYFLDPGRFDLVTFFNLSLPDSPGMLQAMNQEGVRGAIRAMRDQGWGWIIVLGVLGIFKLAKLSGFILYLVRGRSEIALRIFLGLLAGYMALATGPLGASRFLLPVELLIIGASIRGWIMLLHGPETSS